MKDDIKTTLAISALLISLGAVYYATSGEINALSLKVKGLQTENHDIRDRLDEIELKFLGGRR